MFKVSDKVVCIHSFIPGTEQKTVQGLFKYYPQKGETYIIRKIMIGKDKDNKDAEALLFKNIYNYKMQGNEPGYNSIGFRKIDNESNLVYVGNQEWINEAIDNG